MSSQPRIDFSRVDETFISAVKLDETMADVRISNLDLKKDSTNGFERKWRNTQILMNRLADHQDYTPPNKNDELAPYGRYKGHPIIGTKTKIISGVYMGHGKREAILVDMNSRAGVHLRTAYMDFLWKKFTWKFMFSRLISWWPLSNKSKQIFKTNLEKDLLKFVQKRLPFNDEKVSELGWRLRINNDVIVSLDTYLEAGFGVCRHQMCLLGAILEKLIEIGFCGGFVEIHRRHIPGLFGHAWIRYTHDSEVWIIDPSQDICSRLSDMDNASRWFYDHGQFENLEAFMAS